MSILIRATISVFLTLAMCGCDRLPESYSPPRQRPTVKGYDAGAAGMMVEMDTPGAEAHFVKDIYEHSDTNWRWTAQQPTVNVLVFSTQNIKFSADFAIWDQGFKQTGPLELTFLVNGKVLDKVRYAAPGSQHYEKLVPAEWLNTDVEDTAQINIDKLYVAPEDGKKFGIILSRIGFVQ